MPEGLLAKQPLVIMGDEDTVLGFQGLGFKIYAVRDQGQGKIALEEILREQSAICLVEESLYSLLKEEINNYKSLPFPIFIPFAKSGKSALLDSALKSMRIRATGAF